MSKLRRAQFVDAPADDEDRGRAAATRDAAPIATWRHCAECESAFGLSAAEVAWFVDRRFHLPNRCAPCRALRRQARLERGEADE